jgi:hypothetical protein
MRLVAIFHCWHDWYLLRYAVDNIRQLVDGVIIIGSTKSNYGEYCAIPKEWHNSELHVREPRYHIPLHSETDKRNYGLDVARREGYTHFITLDSDELYKQEDFLKAKERFKENPNLIGIVCPLVVYFKSPTLSAGRDVTLVPHIHRLTSDIKHEFNRDYPFAWSKGQIQIDPSRSLNINYGVEYMDIEMHHYSYVRQDLEVKIRNSTARKNIERSTIREDYANARPGYYCKFYKKVLTEVPNYFNITANNFALTQ